MPPGEYGRDRLILSNVRRPRLSYQDAPVTGIIQTEIPMADEIGNREARRSSKGVHGCAVCGASALFGFANDPRVRYCADHMPGLFDADRAIYRQPVDPAHR